MAMEKAFDELQYHRQHTQELEKMLKLCNKKIAWLSKPVPQKRQQQLKSFTQCGDGAARAR